ncbi:uncharacterized protein [Branchiostoma lanceolatum]|uniref:uncharacterized protein n=1 Tax=Branchiostoma lanceolatum TaxID=7740 RepID=UPI003455D119
MAQATADVSKHIENLRKLCRLCGRRALSYAQGKQGLSAVSCLDFVQEIKSTFGVDVLTDNGEQEPPMICHSCRKKLYNDINYMGAHSVWQKHSPSCSVCSQAESMRKGGRPKKVKYGGRRQSTGTTDENFVTDSGNGMANLLEAPPPPQSQQPALPEGASLSNNSIQNNGVQSILAEVNRPGPLRPWEEQILTPLIKRKLASSNKRIIKCKTGGQPITLARITSARKTTTEVSSSTRRRRRGEIQQAREKSSGGEGQAQLLRELRALTRQDLQRTLQELNLDTIRIPTGHLLSAVTDIGLTFSQTRKWRRWMKGYNIFVESERTSRALAANILEKQKVEAELLPLVVGKRSEKVVSLRPHARIINLELSVGDTINKTATAGDLTWHEGRIPATEVWVKVLGDHGGDLFKMAYQVLNQCQPNSATTVFCAFKAKDYRENLTAATKALCVEVAALQGSTWSSPDGSTPSLRLFVAGDCAMLSTWYGLSGACGTYPCLWCEVRKVDLKKGEEEGQQAPPARTLATLSQSYHQFIHEGHGDIRNAKNYKNAIASHMMDVPIEQVCIPALHISLGIFQKMFKMLERDLHDLDLLMGLHLAKSDPDERPDIELHPDLHTLAGYIESVEAVRMLDEQLEGVEEEMLETENLLGWAAVMEQEENLNFLALQLRYGKLQKQRDDLRSKAQEVRDKGKLAVSEGPLTKTLEVVLHDFHVKKQAYHSQSFVGNHVNTMLKDAPIQRLTAAAMEKVDQLMVTEDIDFPLSLYNRAQALQHKYMTVFTLFGDCHRRYSHAEQVCEEDISTLDQSIKNFMAFFRTTFPTATVPLKMHILEAHSVPFMKKWKFGLGFFGEQGIERVHAEFNNILRNSTSGIQNEAQQLKLTMERHLLKANPLRVGGVPDPVPRTKN